MRGQLREPFLVAVRNSGHGNDVEIYAMGLMKLRPSASKGRKRRQLISRDNRKHIQVRRRACKPVGGGHDEPTAAMQLHVVFEAGVEIRQEAAPGFGEVRRHTTGGQERARSADSSAALG